MVPTVGGAPKISPTVGGAPKIANLLNIALISLGLLVDLIISIVNGFIYQQV